MKNLICIALGFVFGAVISGWTVHEIYNASNRAMLERKLNDKLIIVIGRGETDSMTRGPDLDGSRFIVISRRDPELLQKAMLASVLEWWPPGLLED